MLAQLLYFLGELFNAVIDAIYKIGLWLLIVFLCAISIATGFAVTIVWLLT